MADIVSIVASCLGIASGITKLIDSISSFISNVQEARRDMNDVQRGLDAVRTILLELCDKGQDLGFDQVPSLKIHVFEVVSNCGSVVADMKKLLRTMRNGSMRWVTSGKKQMAKLKLNLEAHKSTLSIALAFVTGLITADIAQDTRSIKGGTEKMLEEIRFLQAQVTSLDMQQESKLAIQSFLVESVARANSDCSVAEDPQTYWTSLPQQQRDQLLLEACLAGNLKRLELLLRSGANIDARDEGGNTPLLLVIRNQHRHCLPLLFENGASPNDKSAGLFDGKSAFDIAMDLDDTATAEILFRHGVYDPQSIARYSQARLRLRGDLPSAQKTSATTNATSHSSNVQLEEAQFRTWTDQSTSFTIEAEFISLNQGRVTLRGRNDKQTVIPIAKISRQDLDYIGEVLGVALEIDRSQDTGSLPTHKDATASSSEDVNGYPQPQQPGYDYWFLFFCTCDIPIERSESYAQKFIEKSIDESILPLVNAQFWGSHELLDEDVTKVMSFLDDTYRAEVPQSLVRDIEEKDFDPLRGQPRTRWKQNSPQVVQRNPLRPAIKIGPSSLRRGSERGRSQSASPSRQPMRFPLSRSRGASPWREFEQESDTRGRLYRRATWENSDRGRRSRANSWDEFDIMARSRSRSCSLPARYARRRVSQERNLRIRSRTRSNWGGEEVDIEVSRSGWDGEDIDIGINRSDWDGGEVDIEISRSGVGRRRIWRRGRGEDFDDLDPYLLERTRDRRVVYSRGRYYYEGRVMYRGRRRG